MGAGLSDAIGTAATQWQNAPEMMAGKRAQPRLAYLTEATAPASCALGAGVGGRIEPASGFITRPLHRSASMTRVVLGHRYNGEA